MTEFEAVFQENREFIFKYLIRLTGDISLAEELTQEAFFRAYMNFSGLRSRDKASAWLCQIAKNTYYAWYNEHKKLQPMEETELPADPNSIEELFARKELVGNALTCLHALEEPYKEVFMLAVFGQVSLKEISRLFGKSESWARVTFYRARQQLAERMKKYETV